MNKNTIIDILATLTFIVAFVEKHHTFFVGIAGLLSICWWCYQFIKSWLEPKPNIEIVKHMNPFKNPITTYLGILLMVVSLGMFIVPMFYVVKSELNFYIPSAIGSIGIIMLLAPDSLLSFFKKLPNAIIKLIDKKATDENG